MSTAVVAISAAAPVTIAAPVVAPDPIFAAIEAHVRAYQEFIAVLDHMAIVERAAWHAPRGQKRAANKRYAEARAAERRFGDLEGDALDHLVETIPQTLEGAVAVLVYVRKRYEQNHSMEEEGLMALLGSVEQAICRALNP